MHPNVLLQKFAQYEVFSRRFCSQCLLPATETTDGNAVVFTERCLGKAAGVELLNERSFLSLCAFDSQVWFWRYAGKVL